MKKYFLLTLLVGLQVDAFAHAQSTNDCFYKRATESKQMFRGNQNTILFDSEIYADWKGWDAVADQAGLLSSALKSKGIQLLVVPIPTRVMVNPSLLNTSDIKQKAFASQDPQNKFLSLLKRFKKDNVYTVDLLEPLKRGISSYSNYSPFFL